MTNEPAQYVVDTHVLWWYLRAPERLTAAATAVFRLAETGNATIVVPAIAIAEFYFVSVKLKQPVAPSVLLDALASVSGIEVSDLGRRQLERLDQFTEIPEMHDKLIAAEADAIGAPLVTRDATLLASPEIETVW